MGILALTLGPGGPLARDSAGPCLLCGETALADILANLALFAPLGALLVPAGLSVWRAAACAAVLSLGIEVAQALLATGRNASAADLLANGLGGLAGAALVRYRPWRILPRRARVVAGFAATLALLLLPPWLFGTAESRPPLWGSWTPAKAGYSVYGGRILAATIGGLPVPYQRLTDGERVARQITADAPVELRFVAGSPPLGESYVLGVTAGNDYDAIRIGIDGADLVVTRHTRAQALSLRQPALRYHGLLRDVAPGDTLRLLWQRSGEGLCASLEGRTSCVSWSPARGWALFAGSPRLSRAQLLLCDAAWALLALLPAAATAVALVRRRIARPPANAL